MYMPIFNTLRSSASRPRLENATQVRACLACLSSDTADTQTELIGPIYLT